MITNNNISSISNKLHHKLHKHKHIPSSILHNHHIPSISTKQWNFATDYNDHFETPMIAYEDISSILAQLCIIYDKTPENLIIYDPYYCKGNVMQHLHKLGYHHIINENRDFYKDIKNKVIPEYDVLVTNPPYSGEHKQLLFNYLQTCNKPYALLLPAYVATKSYYKTFLSMPSSSSTSLSSQPPPPPPSSSSSSSLKQSIKRKHDDITSSSSISPSSSKEIIYLLPPTSYEYHHPEGTGKDRPPFYSAWFIGGLSSSYMHEMKSFIINAMKNKHHHQHHSEDGNRIVTVLGSVEEMVSRGYIHDKRPNPKTRKRLKSKQHHAAS